MKVSKDAGGASMRIGDVFTKALPVKLADAERAEKAQEMASAQIEATSLEEEKKRVAKDFTDKIKPLKAMVEQLAPVVESGIEERQVEVQWEQELGGASAVLRRLDTGEVLEETRRALNEGEIRGLQETFGFGREGGPAPEEVPSSLIEEALSQGVALGRAEKATAQAEDSEERSHGPVDFRKAPANANRGVNQCPGEHTFGPPGEDGWQACRKCPVDQRVNAAPVKPLTDMGEDDLSESQAALDALEASPKATTLRWPLGDTMWMLAIDGAQLWFHSPDTAASSSRRHGPAGWVPEAHGMERIVAWGGDLGDVPMPVIAAAVALLSSEVEAEGLIVPRSMAEAKAAIAAEREKDMQADWPAPDSSEHEIAPAPEIQEEPEAASLTDLAAAFLMALLDGPLTLEAIRAKTMNRRAGTTAKNLMEKGFVADDADPSRYTLTTTGRQTAELLKKAKDSRKKGAEKA